MVRSYRYHIKELSSNVKIFLVGNAILGLGLSIYSLLLNLYLKKLGFNEATIGGLISTSSLGISMIAIPAAFFIEKFHVKHLVVTGMIVSSFFYLCQIGSSTESGIFIFGLLASMFQAVFNISVAPFYLRNSTPQIRVYLFTISSALNMASHFIGYLLGGYLPEIISHLNPDLNQISVYRLSIVFAISLVLISNLMFIQITKVPIPKVSRRFMDGLRQKDWKILSKLIIPKLCFAFGGGLIVPFMNLYLKDRFNFSIKMIGVSYALLQVFIFLGIFITPQIVRKTTNLRFIMGTALLSVPFMITMGLAASVPIVLSSFFMRGMLMNMSGPITSMFEMERVREQDCVFASALILFFYNLVYTSSTRLGGHLIQEYSFDITFVLAAFFYILAIFFYRHFFRKDEIRNSQNNSSYGEAA
jgi:MFS family permease